MQQIKQLISDWRLNKTELAERIGMNPKTFRNKLNPNLDQYHFTEGEQKRIVDVFRELEMDISSL
jgi:DNA-binding NtrC family response regulator